MESGLQVETPRGHQISYAQVLKTRKSTFQKLIRIGKGKTSVNFGDELSPLNLNAYH